MGLVRRVDEVPEEPHPFLKEAKIRTLLSRRDEGADVTCLLVRCGIGSEIEEHVHADQEDIIYVLEGEATMWAEGLGEFPMGPGTFVVVPRGRRHRTFDVREDLIVYDVFYPPIF